MKIYVFYSVLANEADLGINLQLLEDLTCKDAGCYPRRTFVLMKPLKSPSQQVFLKKYGTEEINHDFSSHDHGFLCFSQEIPDEGTYLILGKKREMWKKKAARKYSLSSRALKPPISCNPRRELPLSPKLEALPKKPGDVFPFAVTSSRRGTSLLCCVYSA